MGIFSGIAKILGLGGPSKKQQKLMNAQIKAYRDQTELAKSELAAKKDQQAAEKRRIDEKQIRALRRSNRAQGFLGTSSEEQLGESAQLGG